MMWLWSNTTWLADIIEKLNQKQVDQNVENAVKTVDFCFGPWWGLWGVNAIIFLASMWGKKNKACKRPFTIIGDIKINKFFQKTDPTACKLGVFSGTHRSVSFLCSHFTVSKGLFWKEETVGCWGDLYAYDELFVFLKQLSGFLASVREKPCMEPQLGILKAM